LESIGREKGSSGREQKRVVEEKKGCSGKSKRELLSSTTPFFLFHYSPLSAPLLSLLSSITPFVLFHYSPLSVLLLSFAPPITLFLASTDPLYPFRWGAVEEKKRSSGREKRE
jgi:hypothetical protein